MILNAEQEREYNRDVELQQFLFEQKKEHEAYAPFNDEVQSLLGNIGKIKALIPAKGKKGIAATEGKNSIKKSLADDVNEICTNASAYALSIGNRELLYAVRYRTSDITNAKDGDVLGIVTTIINAVTPLLEVAEFEKYEITADALSALAEKGEAFDGSRGKAGVIDTGSSIANRDLNNTFKAIRGNINRLNLLINYFTKKNPSFVEGYRKSAAINHSGIRHSGIVGIITNAHTDAPVQGVTITGEGKSKTALTDKDGVYKLVRLKAGNMKITIAASGYETQILDVKIIRGKMVELNISLQTQIITLSATA